MTAATEAISEETLALIKKAQTTGIQENTGVWNYDLSDLINLMPVVTPFRDVVGREKADAGNPYAVWRAFMDVTSSQSSPAMGWDYAANEVVVKEQDFQAKYQPSGFAGSVTQDAEDLGLGYADAYASMTFQALNNVLIGDDRLQMGAQSFNLTACAAPTLTQSATGGTIGIVTAHIGVAARTGTGYFYGNGNSQGGAASTTFTAGATNSITAVVAAVRGAVCYDWFYSADGVTWYYYTTTTVNTVVVTATITANNPLPPVTQCPGLSQNWKGAAGVPTFSSVADNGSGNPNEYDGFIASLSGDYTSTGQWATTGTATANPSVWKSLDGATLTWSGTFTEIEQYLFLPLWYQVQCSPTAVMVNAQQAQKMANLALNSPSATTFLNTDANGRINVTAGGRVGQIINAAAGGVTVPIEVHVSLPPGTIAARTDRVPFPQANIKNVLAMRCLRDTAQFDYGIGRIAGTKGGGPRREFEIRSVSAFANRAPVAMGVISNVS